MRISQAILIAWLCSCCVVAAAQDPAPLSRVQLTGTTMGTVGWSVTVFADPADQADLRTTVEQVLAGVNQRMSTYRPDSEVSRFNASRDTGWFAVSADTAGVVQRARQISQATQGAFDITVAPLVNLWKFGPDKGAFSVPEPRQIEQGLKSTGYRNLEVRIDPPALRKAIPELQIDLSAIAKGFAVDQVALALAEAGHPAFLVDVGGEIRAGGRKPDGKAWSVAVEKPSLHERLIWSVVSLTDQAMASSGDYRNFHMVDGQRYSHTIDPRTGRPVADGPAAVSVIADDCMTADAVATAVMVLGGDDGKRLARELGVALLVLNPTSRDGEFTALPSDNWPADRLDMNREEAGEAETLLRTIAIASLFFLLAVVAMSVGVVFGRQRIRGSCGGIAALDNPEVQSDCSMCGTPSPECRELKREIRRRQQQP